MNVFPSFSGCRCILQENYRTQRKIQMTSDRNKHNMHIIYLNRLFLHQFHFYHHAGCYMTEKKILIFSTCTIISQYAKETKIKSKTASSSNNICINSLHLVVVQYYNLILCLYRFIVYSLCSIQRAQGDLFMKKEKKKQNVFSVLHTLKAVYNDRLLLLNGRKPLWVFSLLLFFEVMVMSCYDFALAKFTMRFHEIKFSDI